MGGPGNQRRVYKSFAGGFEAEQRWISIRRTEDDGGEADILAYEVRLWHTHGLEPG